MSISFEDAVATLRTMFPDWDPEMLSMILESNSYHVERTIESVLSMSTNVGESAIDSSSASPPQNKDTGTNEDDILIDILSDEPIQRPLAKRIEPKSSVSTSDTNLRYRGIKCTLPDDFLRVPKWGQPANNDITDEELARMLQDELFREQVRSHLGSNYINGNPPTGSTNGRSTSADNTATRRPSRGGGGGGAAEDTSSLLKSLASMGSAAKKNLSQLAVRFSQQTSKRSEAGHPREFKHLVESGSFEDEEDEGDATEVMFQHHKSRKGGRTHMLQEDDDDNFDSENPLIKGGATNNLSISSPLKKAQ